MFSLSITTICIVSYAILIILAGMYAVFYDIPKRAKERHKLWEELAETLRKLND